MKELKEGDRVIVDYPTHVPTKATVIDTDPPSFDYGVEYDSGRPDTVLNKYIHKYPPCCEDCGSRRAYHDRKGEWICLWCEL